MQAVPIPIFDFKNLLISKQICKFRPTALFMMTIIPNLYGTILVFMEIFQADPLPTPIFCRNMAKIVQLHSPHEFNFSTSVI